jgi:MOSC domain-containing protein YiiM
MFEGELLEIYTAARKRDPLQAVEQAEVAPGRGLLGDRYCRREGSGKADQEVTLIEVEAIEAAARDCGLSLAPGEARRNLVTRGVPLNHLVGREFAVGEVVLRGMRLCEPCGHLEKLTVAGVQKHLAHRGGLRAEVVKGGVVRPGDAIRPHEPASG